MIIISVQQTSLYREQRNETEISIFMELCRAPSSSQKRKRNSTAPKIQKERKARSEKEKKRRAQDLNFLANAKYQSPITVVEAPLNTRMRTVSPAHTETILYRVNQTDRRERPAPRADHVVIFQVEHKSGPMIEQTP